MGRYHVRVPEDLGLRGERVDHYLAERLGLLTRSQLKNRLEELRVDGQERKLSCRLYGGEMVEAEWGEPKPCRAVPEDLPLEILYEDAGCMVINKPQGMVVHPSAGHPGGTVVNAFLFHLEKGEWEGSALRQAGGLELPGGSDAPEEEGLALRPGVVHRLDKETSGVLVLAKNPETLEYLAGQFRHRSTRKRYLALVKGQPPRSRGTIEGYIRRDPGHRKRFAVHPSEGKYALTRYRLMKAWKNWSLLEVEIVTGRTHQIRVHLRSLGCPVAGDPLYARPHAQFPDLTLMLHARELVLSPAPGEADQAFKAPVPRRFRRMIRSLTQSS